RKRPSRPSHECRSPDTSTLQRDRPSRSPFHRRLSRLVPGCIVVLFQYPCCSLIVTTIRAPDKSSVAQARPSLFGWIVVEEFVKFLARLHFVEPFFLGPTFLESTQKLLARLHRHPECALGKNHHAIAESGQIRKRKQRAFPKLGHVRQQRHIDLFGEIAKFFGAL